MSTPTRHMLAGGLVALVVSIIVTLVPATHSTLEHQLAAVAPRTALPTTVPNRDIQLVAHRGALLVAPESTLVAFDKAIELGFDMVELDVRSTKDGVPVVFHDKTVDRTTNSSGNLTDYTWAELRELDAGSWFDPVYTGTRVPSLEEALAHLQGRVCVMWDAKGKPTAEMVRLFKKYGFDRDCLLATYGGLGSLDPAYYGDRLLQLWPDVPVMTTAKNTDEMDTLLAKMPQLRAVFVSRNVLNRDYVAAAHERGLLVFNSALEQMDTDEFYALAVDSGADFLMIDKIEQFEAWLRKNRRP
ncbi:MAG: glycerophosphodiester phosphodiesterase family protein [Gammaproteobacteria bacterium]|nr:glycerophosphodiester phosphodiesterase family protein [Gammaproteobacteria bacterium]NND54305.1 glycerophosphodiester phosphodiesterase family protein [Gammaproteobacteria bacterium]